MPSSIVSRDDEVKSDLVNINALLTKLTTNKDEEGIHIGSIPLLDKVDTIETSIVENMMVVKYMGKAISDLMDKLAEIIKKLAC